MPPPDRAGTQAPACQSGAGYTSLTPPPVAPPVEPPFQAISYRTVPLASASSVVPPQPSACGLDAGKSHCTAAGLTVGAAIVAARHRDAHAQRGRVGQRGVHRVTCLGGAAVLAHAPADAHRSGRGVGVRSGADHVDEAGVAVRREVHRHGCDRRDGAHDLDVEQHLAGGMAYTVARCSGV